MQIDSTPLDVRVVLDDGTTDQVELTWMIDSGDPHDRRGVLRPTTKATRGLRGDVRVPVAA
jgi:putative transposase